MFRLVKDRAASAALRLRARKKSRAAKLLALVQPAAAGMEKDYRGANGANWRAMAER